MLPDCSKWNIWEGEEIEGSSDIGVTTIFIRDCSKEDILNLIPKYTRVWFCETFVNYDLIRLSKTICSNINVSVYIEDWNNLPQDIKGSCKIYLKIKGLKTGDEIGVGEDFHQEFFTVGLGEITDNSVYYLDRKIK